MTKPSTSGREAKASLLPRPADHSATPPQRFANGEIHDWYRIVLGYSDHLVSHLLDEFHIQPGQKVLDPFCGTGTTLVECMKRGIESVGIEANPSSHFAAMTKANWSINSHRLIELLDDTRAKYRSYSRRRVIYRHDPAFGYLEKTGMLDRGWISPDPLRKALAIKHSIESLHTSRSYKNALMLVLVATVVNDAANVKFGPELYCGPSKADADVFSDFAARVRAMAKDLAVITTTEAYVPAKVILGDSRDCSAILTGETQGPYSAIICSPPYPAEHDYTRNARLELAFLEMVTDRSMLRSIKKTMIRSHTKGIYKDDNDARFVDNHPAIAQLVAQIKDKTPAKPHGFARLYPTIVQEYFGGMKRHLQSVRQVLAPGATCAYIVGDQSSYLQVHIPTAEILSSLACEVGFQVVGIRRWRSRWASATSKEINENILVLRNPDT